MSVHHVTHRASGSCLPFAVQQGLRCIRKLTKKAWSAKTEDVQQSIVCFPQREYGAGQELCWTGHEDRLQERDAIPLSCSPLRASVRATSLLWQTCSVLGCSASCMQGLDVYNHSWGSQLPTFGESLGLMERYNSSCQEKEVL